MFSLDCFLSPLYNCCMNTKIISLGGSIVAPEGPDAPFVARFAETVRTYLAADKTRRLILIVGGGGPARIYQKACRDIVSDLPDEEQDWIGIMATRLNAQFVKAVFAAECPQPVICDPTASFDFEGRILVAAGWKPGFSTDTDAVYLAEKFAADTVINLSNIAKVYTDDPKLNPDAEPVDAMSWNDFIAMVGTEWTPGKNLPFDPIASQKAAVLGLKVICAGGRDLDNIAKLLNGEPFFGTVIG